MPSLSNNPGSSEIGVEIGNRDAWNGLYRRVSIAKGPNKRRIIHIPIPPFTIAEALGETVP